MKRLQTINITRCDEASWRFLGISLAGYNAAISAALAATALGALGRRADALISQRAVSLFQIGLSRSSA
jgi:disulfide bond formation protein DsbB